MKTLISKGEFATLKQRSPACVAKWIKHRKISPEALIGEGLRAKIWVERAEEDLTAMLDPAQQAGQPVPANMSAELPPDLVSKFRHHAACTSAVWRESEPVQHSRTPSADDENLSRRRAADAARAEYDAETARRKLMVDEGRWLEAGPAMKEWSRQLARLTGETETFLFNNLARDIAEQFGLDWKQVSTAFREGYRKHRAAIADEAGEIVRDGSEAAK